MRIVGILLLLLWLSATGLRAEERDFGEFVREHRARLWELGGEELLQAFQPLLKWNDSRKTSLRFARNNKTAIRFENEPVQELLLELKDGRLAEIYVSLYNRGDAAAIPRRELDKRRRELEEVLQKFVGEKTEKKRDGGSIARSEIDLVYWQTDEMVITLKWSFSKSVPEYLTLTLQPPGTPVARIRRAVAAAVSRGELPDNVIVDDDGTRHLDIPMIDQGEKGYCAAATIARIMQYYQADVDQHLIAQLAKTDSARGTLWLEVLEALERAGSKMKIRVEKLYACNYFSSVDNLRDYVRRYNRTARSLKKRQIEFNDFILDFQGRQVLHVDLMFAVMDKETIRKMRTDDKKDYEKFRKSVIESIDRGIPVIWMIPSHMRIINGYNQETGEIIYTDSYGAGHEKKRMDFGEALSITINAIAVMPRQKD